MTARPAHLLLALAGATCQFACIARTPPAEIRWFRPELPAVPSAPRPDAPLALALERVTAAPHLGERMVWRISEIEYAFDDLHRWIEPPDTLVRNALERVLYGECGFSRAGPRGAGLEVHLGAFEASAHEAVVEMTVTLIQGTDEPRRTRILRATTPLESPTASSFAAAVGTALRQTVVDAARFARDGLVHH